MNLRKIDRLVAEKINGWHYDSIEKDYFIKEYLGNAWHKKFICHENKFTPTSDIVHAWKVVEKLTRGKKDLETYFKLELFGVHYYAKFGKYEAKAETAPLAICLAALKAVGVEVEVEGDD